MCISLCMGSYRSGAVAVEMEEHEPAGTGPHPALLVLHGSGGAGSYWMSRFAPTLTKFGVAAYAPHYLQKTQSQRATAEMILDGVHFPQWLEAIRDAASYVAQRPGVDARRIGVLGVSLGGYLAVALGIEDRRMRAVVELSGGLPQGWESRVAQGMAPVLILHGGADTVVPAAEAYKLQAALKEQRVACETEIIPGEGHWFSAGAQTRVLMSCARFLGQYL